MKEKSHKTILFVINLITAIIAIFSCAVYSKLSSSDASGFLILGITLLAYAILLFVANNVKKETFALILLSNITTHQDEMYKCWECVILFCFLFQSNQSISCHFSTNNLHLNLLFTVCGCSNRSSAYVVCCYLLFKINV